MDLGTYTSQESGDETILGAEQAGEVRSRFDLNLVGKSHDGGWPRLRVETCADCRQRYLVYVGVREPANGWVLVTVQGIAMLDSDAAAV